MKGINWYELPGHQHLYEAEVSVLKSGLGGDFELVGDVLPDGEGRLIASGWLRYSEDKKHAVRVVFPTKYPYAQPQIYPLQHDQEGNIVGQAQFFSKGNQYGNGAMCLLRKDQWSSSEHNIGSFLRRAQRWLLRATSAEGFPLDEIVEEIPPVLKHSGQIIMPALFQIPQHARIGDISLTQFKPNHYIVEENTTPKSPFVLQMGKEVFRWYSFERGLTFKTLFPSFSVQALIQVLQQHFAEDPVAVLTIKNVALHIPDDPNPWHFFKIQVLQHGQQIVASSCTYLIARIIDRELFHRTKDIFSDAVLKHKKVTIIGLGALGSEVARSLARNGVGVFDLFDYDTFEVGNSVRHAADLYYIGELKTAVTRQLILRSNPNSIVNEYPVDVLNDTGLLEQSLQSSNLCIVLTAEESVDYMINDLYVSRYEIPFVFARVSAGGLSGSVQIVQREKFACLRCLSNHGADTLPIPKGGSIYGELGPEYGSCSTPAVPGSEIDTKEVALQVARISLQLLLEEGGSTYAPKFGNHYYWHGPFGSEQSTPFTWEIINLQKHPDCEQCN